MCKCWTAYSEGSNICAFIATFFRWYSKSYNKHQILKLRISTHQTKPLQTHPSESKHPIRLTHHLQLPNTHPLPLRDPLQSHCPLPSLASNISNPSSFRSNEIRFTGSAWEVWCWESAGECVTLAGDVFSVTEGERCGGDVEDGGVAVSVVGCFYGVDPIYTQAYKFVSSIKRELWGRGEGRKTHHNAKRPYHPALQASY